MPASRLRHLLRSVCFAALLLGGPALGAPAADDTGGTDASLRHLAGASRAAYHGHYSQAIAITNAVIADEPHFARAYFFRAGLMMDAGRYDESLADLDTVLTMHPDAKPVYVMRAEIALRRRDGKTASAELTRAAQMPATTLWKQHFEAGHESVDYGLVQTTTQYEAAKMLIYSSISEELLGHDDAALDNLKSALDLQTERPWYVLNQHCYTAAVAGLLDMAELTCGEAIDRQDHDTGAYDSMGFVHLRMKAWDKAIADYGKSLAIRPDFAPSLYGRGIARRAQGDIAGGNADIAAAKQGEPDIASIMARLGVKASG